MLKLKVSKPTLYKLKIEKVNKFKLKANATFPNIIGNGINAYIENKTLIISGGIEGSELVL